MKYIFTVAVGLLLIAGCCNSFEKRAASDYLVVDDEASLNSANEAAAGYTKVVAFHARSFGNGIIGGSHMQSAAGSYAAGDILFITYKLYDSNRQYTYDFIENGETVHQETDNFLSSYTIQDLITEYFD